jgi:hypothetical protein
MKPVTLPILAAFDYLYKHRLTHATVKPAPIPAPADPKPPKS